MPRTHLLDDLFNDVLQRDNADRSGGSLQPDARLETLKRDSRGLATMMGVPHETEKEGRAMAGAMKRKTQEADIKEHHIQ